MARQQPREATRIVAAGGFALPGGRVSSRLGVAAGGEEGFDPDKSRLVPEGRCRKSPLKFVKRLEGSVSVGAGRPPRPPKQLDFGSERILMKRCGRRRGPRSVRGRRLWQSRSNGRRGYWRSTRRRRRGHKHRRRHGHRLWRWFERRFGRGERGKAEHRRLCHGRSREHECRHKRRRGKRATRPSKERMWGRRGNRGR